MEKVKRKITVDMSRRSNTRVVFATQNDLNSRCLSITLTDDGKPYKAHKDLTATVNFRRSDEKNGAYLARICDDGTVEYLITPTVLKVAGQTECTVSLFNDVGDKLTSSPFVLDVAETLYDDNELSEDPRLDYIDEMIAKFTVFKNQEDDRIDAEDARESNEGYRFTAELERQDAETVRAAAELVRDKNEKSRKASEDARNLAEVRRSELMQEYAAEENARQVEESRRIILEDERRNGERARDAAENERKTAERYRQQAYENIDKALDAVLAIQATLMGGDAM